MANPWDPQDDSDVETAVRAETQYDDNADELPSSDLQNLIGRAKHRVSLETGDTSWYSDSGLGLVLIAYTCMRAKAAVENAFIESYSIGDQDVTVRNADPETSQQIQQWAEDVRVGLDASSADTHTGPLPRNTSDYVGRDHIHHDADDERTHH